MNSITQTRSNARLPLALLVALVVGSDRAMAATCYSYYYGYYTCNGLSAGARAGIGIAIAVGVLALIALLAFLRRRRTMKAFRANQQVLPTTQTQAAYPSANTYYQGQPQGATYGQNFQTQQPSPYAQPYTGGYQAPQAPPPKPAQAYRVGSEQGGYMHNDANAGVAGTTDAPPPSYVDVSQPNAQGQYAAPSGPPPASGKAQRDGAIV